MLASVPNPAASRSVIQATRDLPNSISRPASSKKSGATGWVMARLANAFSSDDCSLCILPFLASRPHFNRASRFPQCFASLYRVRGLLQANDGNRQNPWPTFSAVINSNKEKYHA